jgi:hypothetical protein
MRRSKELFNFVTKADRAADVPPVGRNGYRHVIFLIDGGGNEITKVDVITDACKNASPFAMRLNIPIESGISGTDVSEKNAVKIGLEERSGEAKERQLLKPGQEAGSNDGDAVCETCENAGFVKGYFSSSDKEYLFPFDT